MKLRSIGRADLARAIGISPSAMTQWLSGTTKKYDAENILKASDVLKINPRWLVFGVGPVFAPSDAASTAAGALDVLQADERQEAFDFILYKIDRAAELVLGENACNYHSLIAEIIEDMKKRKS